MVALMQSFSEIVHASQSRRMPLADEPAVSQAPVAPKLEARDVSFFYGRTQALFDITMSVAERRVTAPHCRLNPPAVSRG